MTNKTNQDATSTTLGILERVTTKTQLVGAKISVSIPKAVIPPKRNMRIESVSPQSNSVIDKIF